MRGTCSSWLFRSPSVPFLPSPRRAPVSDLEQVQCLSRAELWVRYYIALDFPESPSVRTSWLAIDSTSHVDGDFYFSGARDLGQLKTFENTQ